jgi:C4-dicarboxylate transporter DctQ subunit
MKILNVAGKTFDKILNIFAAGGNFFMGFVMVLVLAEILMRSFFNRAIIWSVEVTEYSILWMTFLATAWILRDEGHVLTDLVIKKVSPQTRKTLNIFTSIIAACGCLVFTYYSAKVTLDMLERGLYLSTVLKPPAWAINIIIPIGGILLSIQFIRRAYNFIFEKNRGMKNANLMTTSHQNLG